MNKKTINFLIFASCCAFLSFAFSGCVSFVQKVKTADDIQKLIDSSPFNGGDLLLPQGIYLIDKTIIISSNTNLRGVGSSTLLFAGKSFSGPIFTNSSWTQGNQNIKISNLRIVGSSAEKSLSSNNYHKRAYAMSLSEIDNLAIYFKNLKSAEIEDLEIEDFKNEAIMLVNSSNISILKNKIKNCSQKAHENDWAQGAIYLRHSSENQIRGNMIFDCYEGGIVAGFDSHENVISTNTVKNSQSGEGVFIGCGNENIVYNNNVENVSHADLGSGAGIAISVPPSINKEKSPAKNNIIIGNIVNITGGSGISLYRADSNKVLFNSVSKANQNSKNGRGGISVYEAEANQVIGNRATNCLCPGISVQKAKDFTIRFNALDNNSIPGIKTP